MTSNSPSRPRRGAVFAAATALAGESLGVPVREVAFVEGEGRVSFRSRPIDPATDQAIASAGPAALAAVYGDAADDSPLAGLLLGDPLVSELVLYVARRLVTEGALSREQFVGMVGGSRLALRRIREAALPGGAKLCAPQPQEIPECMQV